MSEMSMDETLAYIISDLKIKNRVIVIDNILNNLDAPLLTIRDHPKYIQKINSFNNCSKSYFSSSSGLRRLLKKY